MNHHANARLMLGDSLYARPRLATRPWFGSPMFFTLGSPLTFKDVGNEGLPSAPTGVQQNLVNLQFPKGDVKMGGGGPFCARSLPLFPRPSVGLFSRSH